jgi:hypothetical protein
VCKGKTFLSHRKPANAVASRDSSRAKGCNEVQSNSVITSGKGLNALCVVITEECNAIVNSEALTGIAEHLTL